MSWPVWISGFSCVKFTQPESTVATRLFTIPPRVDIRPHILDIVHVCRLMMATTLLLRLSPNCSRAVAVDTSSSSSSHSILVRLTAAKTHCFILAPTFFFFYSLKYQKCTLQLIIHWLKAWHQPAIPKICLFERLPQLGIGLGIGLTAGLGLESELVKCLISMVSSLSKTGFGNPSEWRPLGMVDLNQGLK